MEHNYFLFINDCVHLVPFPRYSELATSRKSHIFLPRVYGAPVQGDPTGFSSRHLARETRLP